MLAQGYVLSFTSDVSVDNPAPDQFVIQTPNTRSILKDVTPGVVRAIEVLSLQGATEDDLAWQVAKIDGEPAITKFYQYLSIFAKCGMIKYLVFCNGRPLAALSSISSCFRCSPRALDRRSKYVLSRFAYIHREKEDLILESPLSLGRITLHGWRGGALAAELARAQTCNSLCDLLDLIPRRSIELFLGMLLGSGFLCEERLGDPYAGEGQILAKWDFHDLLFHERHRLGRHANRLGVPFYPSLQYSPSGSKQEIDLFKPATRDTANLQLPVSIQYNERSCLSGCSSPPPLKSQREESFPKDSNSELLSPFSPRLP